MSTDSLGQDTLPLPLSPVGKHDTHSLSQSQREKEGRQPQLNMENKIKHKSASSKVAGLCLYGVEGEGRRILF